ncbi:hypothetical protein [Streptomyces sp. NPDC096030]|uniref:hypothetical protein n=1 Tax=Streptomyces sp. NPDC096030 TaxID=3155423 RepID=UPI0033238805
MKNVCKLAAIGLLSASLAGTAAGAASAKPAAGAHLPASSVSAGPSDDVSVNTVTNTVKVTNNTGKKLWVSNVWVTPAEVSGMWWSDGPWVPKAGESIPAGESRSYGVQFIPNAYLNPEVAVELKDDENRTAQYQTQTWIDGGSTLVKFNDRTYYKVHGENASPGWITDISIENP